MSLDKWLQSNKRKRLEAEVSIENFPQSPQSTSQLDPTEKAQTVNLTEKHTLDMKLPVQKIGKKTLSFQEHWCKEFTWLIKKPGVGVLCKICSESLCKFDEAKNVFYKKGFNNWNKALEKFREHEKHKDHQIAIDTKLHVENSEPIENQLNKQMNIEQERARKCLIHIFEVARFLARQNLAFRGHEEDEGNFMQLIKMLKSKNSELIEWLERKKAWISWKIQNEIIDKMSDRILKNICNNIIEAQCFSLIVDGTQDISGIDQHSICIRYVTDDFEVREEFLGFYEVKETTGKGIADVILRILRELNISINYLRWQTYDGAANMSGIFNGVQTIVKEQQPLADYVHCTAHASNLAAQAVATSSILAASSMDAVNELGNLFSRSGKLKNIMKDIISTSELQVTTIRPLCPTRWLTRVEPVRALLIQFPIIIESLETIRTSNPKASGIIEKLSKGNTILGLVMSIEIFSQMEILNKTLQGKSQTVSGALKCMELVVKNFEKNRHDESFRKLYSKAEEFIKEHDLEPIVLSRKRCPPKRYTGNSESYNDDSPFECFKKQYYAMIDTSIVQLKDRIQQEGMKNYLKLENVLLTGKVNEIIQRYPEFNYEKIKTQLPFFRQQFNYKTFKEAADCMKEMVKDVKNMFTEVERLIKLLMTCPASSCEAERSFSALRRLKTYLRSTMTQNRLRSIAICHVHKHTLDKLNILELAAEFINVNEYRKTVFGQF